VIAHCQRDAEEEARRSRELERERERASLRSESETRRDREVADEIVGWNEEFWGNIGSSSGGGGGGAAQAETQATETQMTTAREGEGEGEGEDSGDDGALPVLHAGLASSSSMEPVSDELLLAQLQEMQISDPAVLPPLRLEDPNLLPRTLVDEELVMDDWPHNESIFEAVIAAMEEEEDVEGPESGIV